MTPKINSKFAIVGFSKIIPKTTRKNSFSFTNTGILDIKIDIWSSSRYIEFGIFVKPNGTIFKFSDSWIIAI